jgi:hypothetical protein
MHTHCMLFNDNETLPSCDKAIQGLNKKCRLSYHKLEKIMSEIRPSCDEAIQGLNKKRRLSYRNLKKITREIHPSCDEAIQELNKKRRLSYHNLKKFICKREKNIGGIGTTGVPVSNVNASQTTLDVHTRYMLFNHSKFIPVAIRSSSGHLAFSQIRPWGYKRPQMGLTRSIINVHVQLDVVKKALPQFISDTLTIVVALKRFLQYKNAY